MQALVGSNPTLSVLNNPWEVPRIDSVSTTDAIELGDLLLDVLPPDGSAMGNLRAREALSRVVERQVSEEEYKRIKTRGLTIGTIAPDWMRLRRIILC